MCFSSSSSFFCCSSSLEVDSPQHLESDVSICLRRIDDLQRASVLRSPVVKPNFAELISATSIQNIATESIFTELSSVTMPFPAPNNCPKPNCGRALDGLDVQDGNTIFCHLCRFPHCKTCGHCQLPDEWKMLWDQIDGIHRTQNIPKATLKEQAQISLVCELDSFNDLDPRSDRNRRKIELISAADVIIAVPC